MVSLSLATPFDSKLGAKEQGENFDLLNKMRKVPFCRYFVLYFPIVILPSVSTYLRESSIHFYVPIFAEKGNLQR